MADRFLVILPTFNESENLSRIVPQILAQDGRLDVLVVDDSSPDGTGRLADELAAANPRVHVLHREQKSGLGRAYLAGFAWALEAGYDLVCEMDADFSHDPKFLHDLIGAAEAGADLVIGSRYKTGVNVINWPMSRLLLSYFANGYARWVTGMPLADATAGFKCFRRSVLEGIPLREVKSNGYAFQIEMNFRAWRKKFRLVEVPIVFTDRVEGRSKMNRKIVREGVWVVWWLRLASLFGRL
ncbi:MAG TPA: polyprenol monophosphomannose synthase [Gemmatimonadales bacterium]|jgi:dolichol-phosphate mannosyltransferase|nr:polyprenol monophosphomannose synthase [Gemmatimonadales bacterium]